MKVALVLGGERPSAADLALARACETIVAADGGAAPLLDAGIVPHWVVGDMDSLGEERLAIAEARGARAVRFPERKDETDGERALEQAIALGASELVMLGAHGGRTAMLLGNLALLRRAHEAGLAASMVGRGEVLRFASPDRDVALERAEGRTLNVLAHGGDAVVSLHGVQWPLDHRRLRAVDTIGLSNVVAAPLARVEAHEGLALTILEAR